MPPKKKVTPAEKAQAKAEAERTALMEKAEAEARAREAETRKIILASAKAMNAYPPALPPIQIPPEPETDTDTESESEPSPATAPPPSPEPVCDEDFNRAIGYVPEDYVPDSVFLALKTNAPLATLVGYHRS